MRPSPSMVVALLALFIALGGTGYAITALPKNSVASKQLKKNAVTGPKIHKNAITSAKVKDLSLLAKDFKAGEIPAGPKGDRGDSGPPGPTFVAGTMGTPSTQPTDPPASPDESSGNAKTLGMHFDVTLPAAGDMYVRFFVPGWSVTCAAGAPRTGLYLDDAPVPKTSKPAPTTQELFEIVAVVPVGAGAHSLEVRADCPDGNPNTLAINGLPDWTVLLAG